MVRYSFLDTSPKKLNMVARQIRGLPVTNALAQMIVSKKKAAEFVRKLLVRATVLADKLQDIPTEKLVVGKFLGFSDENREPDEPLAQSFVGRGPVSKKIDIKGRGRFGLIQNKTAHLTIVVQEAGSKPSKL